MGRGMVQLDSTLEHRVGVQYLHGQQKPVVSLTQDVLTVGDGPQCVGRFNDICLGFEKVIVYGPALERVTVKSGSVVYYQDSQSSLAATLESSSSLSINGDLDALTLTTPQLCDTDSAHLYYDAVNTLVVNGQKVTAPSHGSSCLNIN